MPFTRFAKYDATRDPQACEALVAKLPGIMIADFLKGMPPGDRGLPIGKNVCLLNPLLGKAANSYIYELHQNQLTWIAQQWAEICSGRMVDAMDETPLLIGGGEWGTFLITPKGTIVKIDVGRFD